ncbi:MAG: NTP transferase domain-containing protein [Actinobacteria bacterium]|nr:NTP transferase domain-containing protein [Actinomycetota bacterium]
MTEAILLVGGQGTRLRPLTISTPKPMLPVAGFPCTEHQIARAAQAGVTRIVLGTSFRAEVFQEYFAGRDDLGVEIVYAVEDHPLGTGGAIRNAARYLNSKPDEPVIVFNGDVLTGLDIGALVQQWRDRTADVAIYLTRVDDPRAYGLVPTDSLGNVLAFTEKPQTPAEIVTDQINAGCYVFRRSVIDEIPDNQVVSVERETFPALLTRGATFIGVVDDGYWLDLGTPLAFAQGSADLVLGVAPTPLLEGRTGKAFVHTNAEVSAKSELSGGTFIGANVKIGAGATIEASVIYEGAVIGDNVTIVRSIIGSNSSIGDGTSITESVVAEHVEIGQNNELISGARVFPHARIDNTAIRFSSDRS